MNVSKCVVVVFSKSKLPGSWIWGEHTIPRAGGSKLIMIGQARVWVV